MGSRIIDRVDKGLLVVIPYYSMPTITFKVTEDEARTIRARARKEGASVSEYLRRRASLSSAATGKPRKLRKVRCPHTGALIFAAPENRDPLTTEAVRKLLADFP